jgi:DNA-binding MarR family transcriptional regulator
MWYVQYMNVRKLNNKKPVNHDSYKSLLLLDEISKGEDLSQRDLSKRLNIALGLVNSYIKNLISKGYITIKNIPSKRYAYYLTPKGFAEKSRLTYDLLYDYTRIFREARRDFRGLFNALVDDGIKKVVFAGADEVAEIAYLSLQEVDIELAGIVDDAESEKNFFKTTVKPLKDINGIDCDMVVLTTFLKRNDVYKRLIDNGVDPGRIRTIYQVDTNDKS